MEFVFIHNVAAYVVRQVRTQFVIRINFLHLQASFVSIRFIPVISPFCSFFFYFPLTEQSNI